MSEQTIGGRDPGYFGHGVIGAKQAAAERKLVESGATVFGHGVIGKAPEPPAEDEKVVSLSLAALKKELADAPTAERLSELVASELARPSGPRAAAVAALEAAGAVVPKPEPDAAAEPDAQE